MIADIKDQLSDKFRVKDSKCNEQHVLAAKITALRRCRLLQVLACQQCILCDCSQVVS